MATSAEIVTGQGRFTADMDGPHDGPLVLLLHGFPQSRHTWRAQIPALAQAGYRAVAPDGRGYSPGVRPDPTTALDAYSVDRLVGDVLDQADAVGGAAGAAFHLVGHDWGGQVAWITASRHPERLASLTILSRPHPEAFWRAVREDPDQRHRSRHHRAFLDPGTEDRLLHDGARPLREMLAGAGVPEANVEEYLGVVGDRSALSGALAWYRANDLGHAGEMAPLIVPTLYLWGEEDATVGRAAAEGTAQYVRADFRFEPLPGVGHFLTDQSAGVVNRLLLHHLAAHPA
jgi:pimeloyl-ACP methyl ester carboxylesterase